MTLGKSKKPLAGQMDDFDNYEAFDYEESEAVADAHLFLDEAKGALDKLYQHTRARQPDGRKLKRAESWN